MLLKAGVLGMSGMAAILAFIGKVLWEVTAGAYAIDFREGSAMTAPAGVGTLLRAQ